MNYVNLGSSGLKVSRLGLGMMSYGARSWRPWVLEEKESLPFIARALELGVTFFDTADMYSLGKSEEILGRALRELGAGRDRVVIATKVCSPMSDDANDRGLSRKHILKSIDHSLRRLGMDHVDLYQMHRFDPATPIEETLLAFSDIIRAGKALYYGASTMAAWQFARLVYTADRLGVPRPVSMQPYYNIVYREEEREMIPFCRAEGIGVIPYSPMARGFVTGERPPDTFGATVRAQTDLYMRKLYYKPSDYAVVERISAVARKRGLPNVQIALAWLLEQPGVTAPIVGATKPGQLEELAGALTVKLEPEELDTLSGAYQAQEAISDLPRPKRG
jgi:aryl-alcohol dehydrogenase (NADP+)